MGARLGGHGPNGLEAEDTVVVAEKGPEGQPGPIKYRLPWSFSLACPRHAMVYVSFICSHFLSTYCVPCMEGIFSFNLHTHLLRLALLLFALYKSGN